ncbi:PepSY domain-containing protein, partial [bacterium]|nr:PepSY domain-containing protein [bacterium]
HSGEIFGLPGKVYVDLLGLVTIFLSVTGIIWFFAPGWIKSRVRRNRDASSLVSTGRWSLRWHNKVGAWTFVLLIVLYLTGMFLRPPLLIAIGNAKVKPLRYTHLDQPNPWYDKLRDLHYDEERNRMFLATSEGIFSMDPLLMLPEAPVSQPPVSVMGINVFEKYRDGYFLIGSFSGLFAWNPDRPGVIDFITGEPYRDPGTGRPVGDYKITGMITNAAGLNYIAEYGAGVLPLHHARPFPEMPAFIIQESRISLWSLCLEIHTGRIFENLTGMFYILIVPLAGITGIIVVFSGYMVWRRKYRKKGYENFLE